MWATLYHKDLNIFLDCVLSKGEENALAVSLWIIQRIAVCALYWEALHKLSYKFNTHESKRRHTGAKKFRNVWRGLWKAWGQPHGKSQDFRHTLLLQFCLGQPISGFQEEKKKQLCSHFIYATTVCLVCKLCHSFHIQCFLYACSSIHPSINKCSSKEDTTTITG